MLNHIGITINSQQEISDFYQEILGFEIIKNFQINSELSNQIFEMKNSAEVFLLKKDNIFLEIFISPQGIVNKYNHVCLSYSNRKDLISQAKEKKYKIRIVPREDFDLVFVYDKSGNIFEIKELVK